MPKIAFQELTAEGFCSIVKEQTVKLDEIGITILKGDNGAGKTTLFSALVWGLYGVPLKEMPKNSVTTWETLRSKEYRGTRVKVKFSVEAIQYEVVRHLDFKGETYGTKGGNNVFIYIDGKLADTQYKLESQKYIDAILGMNAKTFLNTILFGQRVKRLLEEDADKKRELFSKLFDVEFVEEANKKGQLRKEELKSQIIVKEKEIIAVKSEIALLIEKIETDKKLVLSFSDKRRVNVDRIKIDIESLENSIVKVKDFLEKNTQQNVELSETLYIEAASETAEALRKLKQAKSSQEDLQGKIDKTDSDTKELQTKLSEVLENCFYCGAKLSLEKVEEVKEKLREQIKQNYLLHKTKQGMLNDTAKHIAEYTSLYNTRRVIEDRHKGQLDQAKKQKQLNESIRQAEMDQVKLQERLIGKQEEISRLETEEPPVVNTERYEKELEVKQSEHEAKVQQVKGLEEQLKRVSWWVSKGFGENGIKMYVFSKMLKSLNAILKRYETIIGILVSMEVDTSKNIPIFTSKCKIKDREVDYRELSGGEKQRVDIVMSFALHDLISRSNEVNILILDECFEGLDDEGYETAYSLIRKKGAGKAVYIVNHSPKADVTNARVLEVVKSNGTTMIL